MGAESTQAQRAIMFVPFPAQGHITPMLHLARALADRGGITATVADRRMGQTETTGDACSAKLALVPIPSGIPDDGGDDEPPAGFATIVHAMEHHMSAHLERILVKADGVSCACLVVDVLASWAIPMAARCGVPAVGSWLVMLMFASYRIVAAIPKLISKGFISGSGAPLPPSSANGDDEDQVNKHQGPVWFPSLPNLAHISLS